ncbi:MAG: hypothetical protein CSA62_04500 [Planctomycetota bacterium]|nr:MAG: hypothetical protein CSA62_04500 [Planctomycetota bacterium]
MTPLLVALLGLLLFQDPVLPPQPVTGGRYEHPRRHFSVDLGERWAAFDHRHSSSLDSAIGKQAPKPGTPMHDGRWVAIYAHEREAIVSGLQGAYLLPVGDWVPAGSEMRILITTRSLHCPRMEDLEDRDFQQHWKDTLTRHHMKNAGQRQVLWEPVETRWLDQDAEQPKLPTAILRGQVLRDNGEKLALYYQILPGGRAFHRIKAVCRAEALPLFKPELERLLASFAGIAPPEHVLWAQFLRYLPLGIGLLVVLLFLQQRRIRRDDVAERQKRLAAREAAAGEAVADGDKPGA